MEIKLKQYIIEEIELFIAISIPPLNSTALNPFIIHKFIRL